MKKKLLLFTLLLALFTLGSNAQDKTWDFSDEVVWTSTTGVSTNTTDYLGTGLDIISSGSTTGVITNSTYTYPDTFASTRAMTFAGTSGPTPTNRAVSFPVTGNCTVKVWVRSSSSGRFAYVTDGTNTLGSYEAAAPSPYINIITAPYTGGAGTIYIYCTNTMYIAKITLTYDVLGTDDFKAESSSNVYSNGNQVFVSNVKSSTTVSVYNLTGALVKTIETNSDTNFSLESGVWIAKVKSAEGEKSVKLLVK